MKPFGQALDEASTRTGIPVKQVAESAGVSYEQLKKAVQRHGSTNVEDAIRVARFFGLSVEEFLEDREAADLHEIAALYMQLSPDERRSLLGYARGRADATDPSSR